MYITTLAKQMKHFHILLKDNTCTITSTLRLYITITITITSTLRLYTTITITSTLRLYTTITNNTSTIDLIVYYYY